MKIELGMVAHSPGEAEAGRLWAQGQSELECVLGTGLCSGTLLFLLPSLIPPPKKTKENEKYLRSLSLSLYTVNQGTKETL